MLEIRPQLPTFARHAQRDEVSPKIQFPLQSSPIGARRGLQIPGIESPQEEDGDSSCGREFDARGGWSNGFRSCAAWLSWRVGFSPGAAREHVRVPRALGTLPQLSYALARGELSYAKVRELTRVATPETEERLLAVGRAGTAEHVERIVRGWRRMDAKAEAQEATRQNTGRALHVYQDEDGTVTVRGRLAPEVGVLLMKALVAAREVLYQRRRDQDLESDMPTMEQQQADALGLFAETALYHGIDPGTSGERYQVVVHADAAVLADADRAVGARRRDARSGRNVSAFGLRRLARRDAARCGRPGDRGRCTNPHDSAGVTARPGPPRPRLSLPGRRCPRRPGSSHSPLGARRSDHAVQSHAAVSSASPCSSRRGLPGGATARRRAPVSTSGRTTFPGGPAPRRSPRQSGVAFADAP
jgi:uncharacterized protein DUF222